MPTTYKLITQSRRLPGSADGSPLRNTILVVNSAQEFVVPFRLMCAAIDDDIQTAQGSGADALEEIRKIEAGETDYIEADGNEWITHISLDKVWFEGLHNQAAGGDVTFEQYKLAVQTYVRFLGDPALKTIEVMFPDK
jgi:hypothetical protein